MVRFGLGFVGVGVLCLIGYHVYADPNPRETLIKQNLGVQTSMQKARDHLLDTKGTQAAVELLEDQLPYINGNERFLVLLRQSYRKYIHELWWKQQGPLALKYLERLVIIEPTAANDPVLRGGRTENEREAIMPGLPPPASSRSPVDAPVRNAESPKPFVRAKATEDPFDPENRLEAPAPDQKTNLAKQFLVQAEDEFGKRHYNEARQLFEKAFQADQSVAEVSKDRWAYCMMNHVVDQLNSPQLAISPADLQKQVHGAISLAPRLEGYGKQLLKEIELRWNTQTVSAPPEGRAEPMVQILHVGKNEQGWHVAETSHFRIFHNQSREYVERVAQVCEKMRLELHRKWFGNDGVDWTPKCDLILHASAGDYSRITGVPGTSPGHSRIETDPGTGRVIGRRMDMHIDNPTMIETVLPHETTHVVLAGMFDRFAVPRWADEGMAVLSEPIDKIEQHRRNLQKALQEGTLFRVPELMNLQDYPAPRRISAFYAQSVFLVDFFVQEKGAQTFVEFLREGLRSNQYEQALRKHYGWSMTDAEVRWHRYLAGDNNRLAARR